MFDLDEAMARKDTRTVSGGEIKCLFAEIERLQPMLEDAADDADDVVTMAEDAEDVAENDWPEDDEDDANS